MRISKVAIKTRIRRNRILRTLLDESGLSLSRLSQQTGISLPMVSGIALSLKREGFIDLHEEKNAERAGRPPIVANLRGEAGCVFGIDIGHRTTNMVLLDLQRSIVSERYEQSPPLGDDPRIIDWILEELRTTLGHANVPAKRFLGLGVSLPGLVRGREGMSESYLHFRTASVRDLLQARLRKPVQLEHDAKAMALSERWFGAARTYDNALCLNIGWGVGLGILIDGRLCYGRDGYAGELGHLRVLGNGPLCYCGKRGCLETVASGMAIGRNARERIAAGAASLLREMARGNLEAIDAALVVRGAKEGDRFSIELIEEAGRYLGEGVGHLINIFNPAIIILGGRVSQAGAVLLDATRSSAIRCSHVRLNRDVRFTVSTLGPTAGALGVAMLAARELFAVEYLNPSAYV